MYTINGSVADDDGGSFVRRRAGDHYDRAAS